MKNDTLLSVKNLKTHFSVGNSVVKAVDGISFDLEPGKTFAIVESLVQENRLQPYL